MKLKHLVGLRRYRRCRQVFRRPLWVHAHLAAARRRPLQVELVSGGLLTIPDVRQDRPMFDWLLEQSPDPLPVTLENGLVAFKHDVQRVVLRPRGSDFAIFREIFGEDVYGIGAIGGRLGTVVDIGANVGLFALRVAPLAQRVICAEPVETNLALARENIARARAADKIALRKWAVTGESGKTARIYLSDGNSGAHSIRREHAAQWGSTAYEDVSTISLADLFESEAVEHCSLLKCDAEGAEFELFQHLPRDILSRIERIVMEIHLTAAGWDLEKLGALCAQLEAARFRVEHEPIRDRRGRRRPALMLRAIAPSQHGAQRLVA
jgi:FkbM family methyltransferase